jgi:hypothetical protein
MTTTSWAVVALGEPCSSEAGTAIAPALEELEVIDLSFGHAGVGPESRNRTAIVLLSQDIPEAAGHVHQAFGIEVGRAVGHQEGISRVGQLDMLVHRREFSAEDPGDHAGRLLELSCPCRYLWAAPQGDIMLVIATVDEPLAHALRILPRLQGDDVAERIKDPELRGGRRWLVLVRHRKFLREDMFA